MNIFWLLRAKRWAQNPPSMKRVLLGLAVIAVCVLLVVLERYGVLPDWFQAERVGPRILR